MDMERIIDPAIPAAFQADRLAGFNYRCLPAATLQLFLLEVELVVLVHHGGKL